MTTKRGCLTDSWSTIVSAVLMCTCLTVNPATADDAAALQQLREMRRQMAHRQRRVIFNNDGCDCLYFPRDEKVTVENFLAKRTTPLAGTQVDAIAYCTISSGFGFFTHRTHVGEVLTRQPADFGLPPTMRNITQDLIDQGTDCLQAVVEFTHRNQMECFWSMRMNDTHDAEHRPEKPYFLFPQLKVDHPDWLVGEHVKRTPYGRWSSVDYARPEIRDLAFRFIEEVCSSYDVDGVELDFFRHLCYFRSVATGGKASQSECDMMTDLLRRVRTMTEAVGLKRGRPLLVMARASDSVDYNRDIGLDVERWLQEGLLDMLVTTCYFQLNPWEVSVALGHKYGVPVYPCLSDSRVTGEVRFQRSSVESYRGQALNAWAAGADGIHLFNLFDVFGSRSPVFQEVGDPKFLRTTNRLYFTTVRDGNPNAWLAGGSLYRSLPVVTPARSATITADQPLALEIHTGEDFSDASTAAQVTCHLLMPHLTDAAQVQVKLNDRELRGGRLTEGWLDFDINPQWVRSGANRVEMRLSPSVAISQTAWTIVYEGDKKPARPWSRDPGSHQTTEQLADGSLVIADRGTVPGDYLYYRCGWGASPAGQAVVEARVKVVSGRNQVIVTNGVSQERLALLPDRVELWSHPNIRFAMDTTRDFHVYRVVTEGKDTKVYVDDQLRLDAPGTFIKSAAGNNEVCFGAANSPDIGEACWDFVHARVDSQVCQDLVLRVVTPKP